MTVALAIVVAVAVMVAAGLAWAAQKSRAARIRADDQVTQLTAQLSEAVGRLDQVEQEKRSAEVRAGAAEDRLRAAEQKTADAERRAGEAERRVGEAMRRADEAAKAGDDSDAARAAWELEHLRVDREWLDVVGPGVPLPMPWDGSVAAVIATELSVIREVIGTPSDLAVAAGQWRPGPARTALAARLGVEMLRILARSGEEMDVTLEPEALTVSQPLSAGERPADLSALATVAEASGLHLSFDVTEGRTVARLDLAVNRPSER